MTVALALRENKHIVKCLAHMLLSCTLNNMPLPRIEPREISVICYLNGQIVAGALRVYGRKHGLRQAPCTAIHVRGLIRKFVETGSRCDRSRNV